MAKLDRMNLVGIRSFGPDDIDVQKIKFESPLTLIQGQNGCGKTTIIEAIKFAITGELPGGSTRGQGFVYDPKLSKAFESIGQVKLRICDGKGELVTVMKIVRVLQKGPDKLEFKRMDSTVSRGNASDPNHTSNRCADVDQEMCLVLGVSKPIINQVLFCHQEESNWPLEESKKLKERFDEIFDAAKYNKCLEHVNKKIKEKSEKLKLMKFEVSSLLDKKKAVESKKLLLSEKQDKFDSLTKNIITIEAELLPINEKINELYKIEKSFTTLFTNVELKKKELGLLQQQQEDILKNTKEFIGSDEELNQKVNKFQDDLNALEEDITVLQRKKLQIDNTEKDLLKKINNQQTKLGGLQSEEKQNLIRIEERKKLIARTADEFGLTNITITEDSDILNSINKLKSSYEEKKEELSKEQKCMEIKEDSLQSEIDSVREENAQLKQNIDSKIKQLQELKEELRKIKHQLEELNTADDQLKLAEEKLQRVEKEIKALEPLVDMDKLKSNIEMEKRNLKSLQERGSIVENEIKELQQYTNIQTELDLKNETYLNKQNDLKKLQNLHEKTLSHIFEDDNVPSINLKQAVEMYNRKQSKSVKDLTVQVNSKQRDVLKLENSMSTYQEKLKEKENELSTNQKMVETHCKDKPLEQVRKTVHEKLEKLQNDRGIYYSSKYIYQKFIKQFQEDDPCCPLCKRRVEEKVYARTIIEDLKKKIENFPNELRRIDSEISEERSLEQNILTLVPINEKIEKLQNSEIPIIKSQVQKYTENFDKSTEDLNKLKLELSIVQKNEEMSNAIMGDVSLIDQYQKEIKMLKQQITDLERRLPNKNITSNRGIEEAMSERETLSIDIRCAQNNIESTQAKLTQHTERLHKLKEQKNNLIYQQLNIKKNLQDKDHLVTKSVEINNKISNLDVDIEQLRIEIEPMKKKLSICIKKKDDLKLMNRQKLEQFRVQINSAQKNINAIDTLHTTIVEFQKTNINDQMNAVRNEISKLKDDIKGYKEKKAQIENNVDELKRQVTNSRMYYRELQDNVQLREKRKQTATLKKEIEAEEHNLGKNDIKQIREEKSQLIDKYENLKQQKHTAEGKKTTLKEDITDLKKELSLPKNIKIADEHKHKHMEYLLQECTIIDLKEFIKAMDWSLMQYHKKRMIQVNSIIKDLWRTIYKGNDIDYIEIKTDDIKTQGQDKRKLYSYHVVQVKNEVELDMRGRCSAGQRVLASLIIRIALAETFSANCGILALDEPTTNLDRENINSLADALIDLIQQKRQQKNFQLLIITHDQDFVDRLTQMESLDKYYEVRRNASGKSIITVHNRY